MIEINKRKPSEEELDNLVDILNDTTGEPEETESGDKKIARKDNENGIEQNWI